MADKVPLSSDVPFNYMHQVLLGAVRTTLHNIVKNHIVASNRPKVSALIRRFLPSSTQKVLESF